MTTVQDSGAGKLNITNTFTYDAIGNLTLVNGPRTDITTDTVTTAYDAARQPITITDGLTKQTKITYDADGRVITSAKQLGAAWLVSCSTYSASGKPLKTWGPAQTAAATTCPAQAAPVTVTDYTYDALDRNSTVTQNLPAPDGGNRVSQVNYNLDDTVQSTQRAVGTPLAQTYATYTYTLNGQQATAADAKSNLTTYSYDGFDRAVQVNYPDPASANTSSSTDYTQAGYDENGNVTVMRTRKGTVITHTYDNLNRLTARTYPNAADNLTFSYDLRGLKTASQYANGSNTVTYNWDNAGRLLTTSSAGRTLSYAYDLASNRTQTTWPDAFLTTTSYDALNRPLIIKEGTTVNLASYAYDDLSRRTITTLGNGTSTGYTYDTQGNLGSLQHTLNSLAQSVTFSYTRNQLQELKQINTSNTLYVHNLFSPTTSTYQSNGLNQYASQTQNTVSLPYAYDANGNLSTETTSASTTTRSFDEDNRMITQSLGATTLTYDAASRLSKTIINGVETQLLYDGTNLVAEYNSTGTLLKRYVHSNGIDEPIVVYNDATTTNKNWLYADHLGSIVALANTTGAATANYTYNAEGKQGGSTASRFGYTGQQNLSGLGVQYYKARMYSADLGRFIQTDPIGMADDMNLYAYVGNNAVNRTDPSGLVGVALGSIAKDAWGMIDPPGPHDYDYKYTYCNGCDAKMVANVSNSYSVPFNIDPPSGQITLPGNNPIRHDFDGTKWVNQTLEGHIFDGNVTGTISTAANGGVSVDVHGHSDYGPAPLLNRAIGWVLFDNVLPILTDTNVKYNLMKDWLRN